MLVNWKWLIHVISSFIFNYILLCLYLHVGIRKTPHGANTTEERIRKKQTSEENWRRGNSEILNSIPLLD